MNKNISEKIVNHKEVYELAGKKVPPYRITCKEHKELVKIIKSFLKDDFKGGMLASYFGIDIKVVIEVDEYF